MTNYEIIDNKDAIYILLINGIIRIINCIVRLINLNLSVNQARPVQNRHLVHIAPTVHTVQWVTIQNHTSDTYSRYNPYNAAQMIHPCKQYIQYIHIVHP